MKPIIYLKLKNTNCLFAHNYTVRYYGAYYTHWRGLADDYYRRPFARTLLSVRDGHKLYLRLVYRIVRACRSQRHFIVVSVRTVVYSKKQTHRTSRQIKISLLSYSFLGRTHVPRWIIQRADNFAIYIINNIIYIIMSTAVNTIRSSSCDCGEWDLAFNRFGGEMCATSSPQRRTHNIKTVVVIVEESKGHESFAFYTVVALCSAVHRAIYNIIIICAYKPPPSSGLQWYDYGDLEGVGGGVGCANFLHLSYLWVYHFLLWSDLATTDAPVTHCFARSCRIR